MSTDEIATVKSEVLEIWSETLRLDEARFLERLQEQYQQAEEVQRKLHRRVQLLTLLVQSGDDTVVLAAAQELAAAREQHDRSTGKVEKLERDIIDVRARLARWNALRKWAAR